MYDSRCSTRSTLDLWANAHGPPIYRPPLQPAHHRPDAQVAAFCLAGRFNLAPLAGLFVENDCWSISRPIASIDFHWPKRSVPQNGRPSADHLQIEFAC
jgi:hypothetical protein